MEPQWSNVYNKVGVTLGNKEFGGVTMKEVNAGSYLDMVSRCALSIDVEDTHTFDQVMQVANIDVASTVNNQLESTSLF